ncbi:MAG TPA: HDOD domain-containing protein [Burkholderiaceae bacterium]
MNIPSSNEIAQRIQFDEIVKQVQDLPSLPAVVMELLDSIDQEDVDINTLAKKVSHDQALTAKTLRFANSSFYGTPSKVATIQQAITLLGVTNVRNLILAAALSGSFPENQCAGFSFKAFWRHAIGTALCAKLMARHLHVNPDYAFTAGLLHDIGRLVLVTRFPTHYAKVLAYRKEHDCRLLEAERAMLGIDHLIAGHALAVHWHFSEAMQHTIVGHHEPEKLENSVLVSLVHVANSIVHALDLAQDEDDLVPPISLTAWNNIGLEEDVYQHILRETVLQFEQLDQVL